MDPDSSQIELFKSVNNAEEDGIEVLNPDADAVGDRDPYSWRTVKFVYTDEDIEYNVGREATSTREERAAQLDEQLNAFFNRPDDVPNMFGLEEMIEDMRMDSALNNIMDLYHAAARDDFRIVLDPEIELEDDDEGWETEEEEEVLGEVQEDTEGDEERAENIE